MTDSSPHWPESAVGRSCAPTFGTRTLGEMVQQGRPGQTFAVQLLSFDKD